MSRIFAHLNIFPSGVVRIENVLVLGQQLKGIDARISLIVTICRMYPG